VIPRINSSIRLKFEKGKEIFFFFALQNETTLQLLIDYGKGIERTDTTRQRLFSKVFDLVTIAELAENSAVRG
jgi:hypothetical protein